MVVAVLAVKHQLEFAGEPKCGSYLVSTVTWTWKWPGNSTMCTHRRLGSLFRNATYTQSLPDVFWMMPVTQNGVL